MELITKEKFLKRKDPGYEYDGDFFWTAEECFAQIQEEYEDGDLEGGIATVTICKFAKILTGYSIDTLIQDMDEYLCFTPDDYDGGDDGVVMDLLKQDHPELKQKYGELKKNWDEFLVMLDNLFPSLETTRETINIKLG